MSERQKAGSFQEIPEQNQQFISHLQALQESADARLAARQDELPQTRTCLEQASKELTGLRHDKLRRVEPQRLETQRLDLSRRLDVELQQNLERMPRSVIPSMGCRLTSIRTCNRVG